jgi:hypothetical protein
MLDILKLILDVISRALPAIASNRHEQRLNRVGVDLFFLYAEMNEALTFGNQLVSSLEEYVAAADRYDRHLAADYIAAALMFQGDALARIFDSIDSLRLQLHTVGGESFASLDGLLYPKGRAIRSLLKAMGGGRLPSASIEHELRRMVESVHYESSAIEWELARTIEDGTYLVPPGEDNRVERLVAEYLLERKPREQLQLITEALREFRAHLEQNFTIRDVLLDVGKRREERGRQFWHREYLEDYRYGPRDRQ